VSFHQLMVTIAQGVGATHFLGMHAAGRLIEWFDADNGRCRPRGGDVVVAHLDPEERRKPTSQVSSINGSRASPSRRSRENPASKKSTIGAVAAIFREIVRSSRLMTYWLPVAVVTRKRPVLSLEIACGIRRAHRVLQCHLRSPVANTPAFALDED
jgi:hypothetical protein